MEEAVHVWSYRGNLLSFSPQFCCEPKTLLKRSLKKMMNIVICTAGIKMGEIVNEGLGNIVPVYFYLKFREFL